MTKSLGCLLLSLLLAACAARMRLRRCTMIMDGKQGNLEIINN